MSINQGMEDFAARLKAIRLSLMNLTRSEFSKKIDIPEITINQWENRKTKITDSSLSKLLKGLEEYEIKVSKEWFLNGVGISPFEKRPVVSKDIDEKKAFLSLNPKSIVFDISDSSYEPTYRPGDLMGAIPSNQEDLCNMDMIVLEWKNRDRELKRVLETKDKLLFLAPVTSCCFSEAIALKTSMKVYKIVWFKSNSSDSSP